MLDLLRQIWRNCCIAVSDKSQILRRLDDLERRAYALEQDYQRLQATVKAQSRVKK